MVRVSNWLDRVRQISQQIEQGYIDIIIDQCGLDFSVIPAFSGFSPELRWRSLYEGLPEDIYREDAPLLVRIDLNEEQQVRWLYELAQEVSDTAPLLIVGSNWSFSSLAVWLGQCANANHEGRGGIFRFWDTRIFSYLFSAILGDEGQRQLHRPALFWSWMDKDGQPALLPGNGAVFANETCQHITFNDTQFEDLLCLCDAKRFLSYQTVPADLYATKEIAFAECFKYMLAATKEGILFDEERDAWVLSHLTK